MRSSRAARFCAGGLAAIALTFGLSACGGGASGGGADVAGGVDKAGLTEKIKTEPDVKGVPDSVVSCMVDVMLKYGDKAALQGYVDGSVKMDDIKGLGDENKKAKEAGWKCAE